jgi:transposase-like protein
MPKLSEPRKRKNNTEKEKAYKLYKEGMTLRMIGAVCGKSYEWARLAIKELSTVDKA